MTTSDPLYKAVVPVIYMGGTGGHFLSALISRARLAIRNTDYRLSPYGNCHDTYRDLGSCGGVDTPFDQQISRLRDHFLSPNAPGPVYYPPMHLIDHARVMDTFERAIKITYSKSDVSSIAKIFLIKWGVETEQWDLQDPQKMRQNQHYFIGLLMRFLRIWEPNTDYGTRLLNISWQDLISADAQLLIQQISRFTNIDETAFDQEFLQEWRARTQLAITTEWAVDQTAK